MIDLRHPLSVLANRMPWQAIEDSLSHLFARQVRAGKKIYDSDLFSATEVMAGAGVIRGDESNQRCPRYDLFHLLQEHLIAFCFAFQVEVQTDLFHGLNFLRRVFRQAHRTGRYADFP